jgi:hypothetical protein
MGLRGRGYVSPMMGCVVDVLCGGPKAGRDMRNEINWEGGGGNGGGGGGGGGGGVLRGAIRGDPVFV